MAERMPELANGDLKPVAGAKSLDLLSKFMAAHQSHPEFMSETLVQTMAVSMAFAGSETTAISLSAVFYFLLKNPKALACLQAEIDQAGRDGAFADSETGLVTWHESQRLPYLDACIKEAFRLHPAAGLPLERIVPEGGAEIAGHFVEGGTIVGCSAWLIHMDKGVFGDDAELYRPERWLYNEELCKTDIGKQGEESRVKEMNGTMFQFGMGSRTCIGKNISLLEIYKLVPSMLRRFEVGHTSSNIIDLGNIADNFFTDTIY
jgi:cytochrome P450